MGMTQEKATGRQRAVRLVALILAALAVAGLFGWWRHASAPFPVKHQRGDDIVAQAKALFDSDPDQAQAALKRSGRKDITLDIQDDPGIHKITNLNIKSGGELIQFFYTGDCPSELHSDCIAAMVGPPNMGFHGINSNDASTVNLGTHDITLDKATLYAPPGQNRPNRKQADRLLRNILEQALNSLADNW